jgi:hypothetical protein
MAIDISGITNPVGVSSAYDADYPTKWTEELSIFYLRIFDEIQQNNNGELDDFSAINDSIGNVVSPLASLENTLSGRGDSGEDQFSSWFTSIFTEVESVLTEVSEVFPAEYAALPATLKDGLPAIPVPAGGVVGYLMFAVKAFLALRRIQSIIDLIRGQKQQSSGLEAKLDTLNERITNAFLLEDPQNPGEYYSVLKLISEEETQIDLEDTTGNSRIRIYPHTMSLDYTQVE